MDFDMSPYWIFVWGAYGASAATIAGLVLATLRGHARAKKALSDLAPPTAKTPQEGPKP